MTAMPQARRTRRTAPKQIQHVLAKCSPGRLGKTDPVSEGREPDGVGPTSIPEIDVRILDTYRNAAGYFCLVNGERRKFSKRQHRVLKAFAVAQSSTLDAQERHKTVVDADEFHITNDHTNRDSCLSLLRTRLHKYTGCDRSSFLKNEADRKYSLGCYSIDTTVKSLAKPKKKAGTPPKPGPAELMD